MIGYNARGIKVVMYLFPLSYSFQYKNVLCGIDSNECSESHKYESFTHKININPNIIAYLSAPLFKFFYSNIVNKNVNSKSASVI